MQIKVLREACCAQDDQMGPLEATYDVSANATFGELVAMIVESKFLQYSSSHIALQGDAAGTPRVRVFSAWYTDSREAEFLAPAGQSVGETLGEPVLNFVCEA